jgi:hypothetical protein
MLEGTHMRSTPNATHNTMEQSPVSDTSKHAWLHIMLLDEPNAVLAPPLLRPECCSYTAYPPPPALQMLLLIPPPHTRTRTACC